MLKKVTVSFNLDIPKTVTLKELQEYIDEAIEYWGGQRHPDNHLFYKTKPRKLRIRKRIV